MPGGRYDDKLDVALVVRVPAVRDEAQIVPGRPAVYIIPPTSLEQEPRDAGGHSAICFFLTRASQHAYARQNIVIVSFY